MAKQPAKETPADTTAEGQRMATQSPASMTQALGDASSWLARDDEKFEGTGIGTDDIGIDDVRLPRLAIAQGLSPQIAGDMPVDGLKLYDLFNDLTNEIYGRGPMHFVPVRRDVRYIEFRPRDEGGGVLDLNVPANDPRTQWTVEMIDGQKTRVPPKATKFVEFVVLLLRPNKQPEIIVLSIKDTNKWNRAAHTSLSSFIKLRNDDIFGGVYTVTSKPEKNDQGMFGVYVVQNAGRAAGPIRELGKTLHASLDGKNIVVDRGLGEEDSLDEPVEGADGKPVPF